MLLKHLVKKLDKIMIKSQTHIKTPYKQTRKNSFPLNNLSLEILGSENFHCTNQRNGQESRLKSQTEWDFIHTTPEFIT